MMAADCLEALGIKRGDYVIKVNNRKVLDGLMEAIGLGGEANAGRRLTVMRAIDKLDRLGVEGVRLLLGSGRKDESGDFTKGAGLERPSRQCSRFTAISCDRRWRREPDILPDREARHERRAIWHGRQMHADSAPERAHEGIEELDQIESSLRGAARFRGSHPARSFRRARARILHRPGLRGGADLRGQGRRRPAGPLRLGRRRRAL